MKHHTRLFVISAPSGTGKTTICSELLKHDKRLERVVTVTTRLPRQREREGKDYFFVTQEKFNKLVERNTLLEYAAVHGAYYGTPRASVEKIMHKKKYPVLIIDVQGGLAIKKIMKDSILIFLKPPSLKLLKKRLIGRGLDSTTIIKQRLKNAVGELMSASRYDYQVVNDQLERAVQKIHTIVETEIQKEERGHI